LFAQTTGKSAWYPHQSRAYCENIKCKKMKQNLKLGNTLNRQQQSKVKGGKLAMDCKASCPPGQSAGCTGFETCNSLRNEYGIEIGIRCSNPGSITITQLCTAS
jgi:hypothetical protein